MCIRDSLILEEGEAFGFACFLVAHEVEIGRLAELGEDCDNVAFGEVKGKPANEDEGCAAIVGVPRS